jgi:predicted DNA-binding transcriptional regulator YafY
LRAAARLFSRSHMRQDRQVGSRSNSLTIVAILKAFIDQRTWKQADLARKIGVSTATIHKHLVELQERDVPLESEKEHPHVFWSVPKGWFPGGVFFTDDQITTIFRQLSRLPKSAARNELIESLLKHLPSRAAAAAIVPAESTAREQRHLPVIEDAANQQVALKFSYFTAHRGSEGSRHASVQRVLLGPPARFIATCHRSDTLKWFRLENVLESRLDSHEPFRKCTPEQVDAHLRASLDGFHEGGAIATHTFFVRDPDARWVARNLLDEMQFEDVPGGIRVTANTAALPRLARYVVGLGASAKPLTAALEAEVEALAKGALTSISTKS